MRRSATSLLNACCVVGQRSRRWWCPLLSQTGLHWAVLRRAGGESGRQILPRGFVEEADAASHASHCRWHVRVSAGQRTGAPCSRDSSAAAAGDYDLSPPDLWHLNSSDLNPVDYLIWGWMQERVYKTLVRDTNDLKQCLIDWKDTISGVHVCPGSAETLVRRGGVTNHHFIAYSLSNISAKNCQNQLMCVEVILCNISVVLDTACIAACIQNKNYQVTPFIVVLRH